MKWLRVIGSMGVLALVAASEIKAQSILDCSCLSTQAVLFTNACSAFIPDLCGPASNCYSSSIAARPGFTCSQSPLPGTLVTGPTVINFVLVENITGNTAFCAVTFNVGASANVFTALCSPPQLLPCSATSWVRSPPGWTNTCCTNGMTTNFVGVVTNWPILTATWMIVDGCGAAA